MEALHDLVRAGKVRALGASAMYGYQFYNMQLAARDHGWTPFSAMENHYNLLYREDERELIPICRQMGVSLMPYSPLAAGHLTRPTWEADTLRAKTDRVAMGKYDRMEQQDIQIVQRVHQLAQQKGCKMSQIAIAWQWAKGVASPIIGATKARYLDDAAGALDVRLTPEDVAFLEECYVPHPSWAPSTPTRPRASCCWTRKSNPHHSKTPDAYKRPGSACQKTRVCFKTIKLTKADCKREKQPHESRRISFHTA